MSVKCGSFRFLVRDSENGCIAMCIYLILLNCQLKMAKMVNFILYVLIYIYIDIHSI